MNRDAFLFLFLSCGCGTTTVVHDGEPTLGIDCRTALVNLADSPELPLAIAVDAQRVYWTTDRWNTDGGAIYAVSRDGGEPRELASASVAQASDWMAMDEEHLYWSDGSSGVFRLPKSGGEPIRLASDEQPQAMTIGDDKVYWVNGWSELRAAPIDGGSGTTLAELPRWVSWLAFEGGDVFWLAQSDDATRLGRVATDGSAEELLYEGPATPRYRDAQPLVADSDAVYWADASGGTVRRISRHDGAMTMLFQGPNMPWSLVLAGDSLFFTDMTPGEWAVRRIDRDGGRAGVVARSSVDVPLWFYPQAVAAADGEVFWTDQNVDKVTKASCSP